MDGSGELSTALADGAKTAAEQTTNIDGKSEVMSCLLYTSRCV